MVLHFYDRIAGQSLGVEVRQIRAMAFAHHLADQIGCAHTGYALARWYEQAHGQPVGTQRDRRWRSYFLGKYLPSSALLNELLGQFPVLRQVLSNLLWRALIDDSKGRVDWDQFARQSCAASGLAGTLLKGRFKSWLESPSADHLGLLLLLARTQAEEFRAARIAIEFGFGHYFLVCCLDPSLAHVGSRLFFRLSRLFGAGASSRSCSVQWFTAYAAFDEALAVLCDVAAWADDHGWAAEGSQASRTFAALLLKDVRRRSPQLLPLLNQSPPPTCPNWLKARIYRRLQTRREVTDRQVC